MRCLRFSQLTLIAALIAGPLTALGQEPGGPPALAAQTPSFQSDHASLPADSTTVQPIAQPAVRLSDVEGSVRLSDSTGKLFDQALVNMAVLPGMTVETGSDGRAELEFPDGSIARVAPNSSLALSPFSKEAANRSPLTLEPQRGLTYFELALGSSYGVRVGPLVAHVAQGSATTSAEQALLRVNLDATPYQAAVLRGAVHFEDAGGNAAYDLPANETARIDPAAATNYDIVQYVAPDTWDTWNTDRDSSRAQIAGATRAGSENAGPGWNDLNYYGSWYDVPGQGMAWAPDGVDANFDPYGSGSWGYYTNVGYGWVSSYPWGWLPYHCGLWSYYQTYGWMWLPSNCGWGVGAGYGYGYYGGGYGWYPYSRVRNAPPGYRSPKRPLPPGGVGRPPASQVLIAVQKGPSVNFRTPGGPRPTSRTLVVAGTPVQPLPVEARPTYNSFVGQRGYRTTSSGSMTGMPGQSGSMPTRGMHIILPSSDAIQRPGSTYMPAPRISTPPPRMVAPPPAPMPSAPHVSAPAPAAGGHAH